MPLNKNENIDGEVELQRFYDVLCYVLDKNDHFSEMNGLLDTIEERSKLSRHMSDFKYFKRNYGVINKSGVYCIVNSIGNRGKYLESLDPIEETSIVTILTKSELSTFASTYSEINSNVTNSVNDLLT